MDQAVVVRYTTSPEHGDENERLIRAVFAELAENGVEGLSYSAFRLADGVNFVHVAIIDAEANPLSSSEAFAQFQSGIAQRCVEGPNVSSATMIGNHLRQSLATPAEKRCGAASCD